MNIFSRLCLAVFLLVCVASHLQAQQTVSGKVTQIEDGEPLPGVSVSLKGTTTGVITNAAGVYMLDGVPEKAVLVFSFIGKETQEIAVGTRTAINVQLSPTSTELTEVVVTGYTSQQRKDIIGSYAVVSDKQIRETPVVSLDQALQGRAAGVAITQSSGTPGGGIAVRIRGSTSIGASNAPLFIVDGVQVETGGLSQRDFGGQQDNALSLINPNDIESMTIIKDAAAKAVYGARGSNGVVIITTKRGRSGKTVFTADAQRGIADLTRRPTMLNATELLTLQREATVNAKQDADQTGLIPGVTDAVNTNWVDEVLRRGIFQQYNVSASGGSDRTKFYMAGSYLDEEGVQINNRISRLQGTVNLDHRASDKFSLGTNLIVAYTKNERIKGDNFLDGVYSGALKSLPFYAPYSEQGKLLGPNNPGYAGFPNFNPVAQALLPRFEAYTVKILAGLYGEYQFLPDLKLRSKVSMDYNNVTEDQYESSRTAIGGFLPSVGGRGYGVNSTSILSTFINSNILTYTKTIGKHAATALAGVEVLQRTERSSSVTGRLFPSDDFTYINSAGIVDQGGSYLNRSGLFSAFTDVKYSYNDKYLFSASARYDGSSRFGPGRRFGFFPSAGASWRISAEPFMERFTFLDDLRLKASYGVTGNERFGDFQFLSTWASVPYNGTSGTAPSGVGNPNLQWEATSEANVGVETTLWNGRLTFVAEVYRNITNKLLFPELVPLTTGFGSIQGNAGQVSNRGIELSLTTVNIDRAVKWTSSLNVSRNINRVEQLSSKEPQFRGYTTSTGRTHIVQEGSPVGTYWGLDFRGVDPATGDAIYEDVNGDGQINSDDGTVIGNAQPDWFGGITNEVSWRGFTLNAVVQFSYGNQLINFANTALLNSGESLADNQVRAALKRWQKEGDITSVPRYVSGNTYNSLFSSRFVEDGSFVRLKNLTLGYTIKPEWISRFKVSNARIYLTGTNLLTLTRYSGSDPEVNSLDGSTTAQGLDFFTLPQTRKITVGLTIGL